MNHVLAENTQHLSLREWLARPLPTFTAALLFAGLVASCLRIAWNPSLDGYHQYVSIGAVFAAFLCDRLVPTWSGRLLPATCDTSVIVLSLMRVFVPPLPYVSGHTFFATYAALTARRWPLRAIALVVLADVVYTKVFASGGWQSMVGGLAAAGIMASVASVRRITS